MVYPASTALEPWTYDQQRQDPFAASQAAGWSTAASWSGMAATPAAQAATGYGASGAPAAHFAALPGSPRRPKTRLLVLAGTAALSILALTVTLFLEFSGGDEGSTDSTMVSKTSTTSTAKKPPSDTTHTCLELCEN